MLPLHPPQEPEHPLWGPSACHLVPRGDTGCVSGSASAPSMPLLQVPVPSTGSGCWGPPCVAWTPTPHLALWLLEGLVDDSEGQHRQGVQ